MAFHGLTKTLSVLGIIDDWSPCVAVCRENKKDGGSPDIQWKYGLVIKFKQNSSTNCLGMGLRHVSTHGYPLWITIYQIENNLIDRATMESHVDVVALSSNRMT